MLTLWFIFLAALGLGLLVFIHELGHYFVARRVGIEVEAFGIGFGRPIFKWKRDGVEWRINWMPFGGYVKMKGMEKSGDKQPYEIPGGFFASRPIDRIKVALAGPVVNLVFAFLLFTLIWATGGREKPFAEFSQHVGWVDTRSELYAQGLRPGDVITSYDGHEMTGARDHLYAGMLAGDTVQVKGFHVDYLTGEKKPFNYTVGTYRHPEAVEDLMTVGVLDPASYLIYEPSPGAPAFLTGSPMASSGIRPGDRLFWTDGELLFSQEQLMRILNDQKALLTVERNGQTRLARVPRLSIRSLLLDPFAEQELGDWHYESSTGGKVGDATFIPYNITPDGTVEGRVSFLDDELAARYFPKHLMAPVDAPLQPGDKIVAIDSHPVTGGPEIFQALQNHQVNLIVQRGQTWSVLPWKKADADFDKKIDWENLQKLTATIGTSQTTAQQGQMVLLPPITPTTQLALQKAQGRELEFLNALERQREEILQIADPAKQAEGLALLEQQQNRLLLGLQLTDRAVDYNPLPTTLFLETTVQTYRTFEALFKGYLSPKWLSGPVGIVQVMHYGWRVGFKEAIFWLAIISFNLGFLNLLPVPVLDGGHICFSLWEIFTKKRLKAETMEKLIIPFVVLLIAFFVFVTYQDLSRLFRGFF